MARQSVHADIASSIDHTLREEARRAEIMLASVRALALGLVTMLNTFLYFVPRAAGWPRATAVFPLLAAGWLGASLVILEVVRRGNYRSWMRVAFPVVDGGLIAATFVIAWNTSVEGDDRSRHGVLAVWIVCWALLAASGGLRLSRGATVWTTAIAEIGFVLTTWGATEPFWVLYGVSMLASVGALSMWMTQITRRAIRSEVGRVTLTRFLPDRVVDAAREDPMALLTDPKSLEATVLVSDLRGFTSLAETLTPNESLTLLNEIQGAFARAVRSEGGTVDKFIGDGMLAVFGAPEPMEDDAERAIEAVRRMRLALESVNVARKKQSLPVLRMGVGIHSGPVVTGCLGSGAHLEFTVIGDTVNTTSRLESATKEKDVDVLVSATTAARLASQSGAREAEQFEPLGEIPIRGRQGGLGVLRLLGA